MPAIDVTIVGNLARSPETKVTAGGVTACTFTIASNERYRDGDGQWKDGPTSWVRCCAWRDLADPGPRHSGAMSVSIAAG